MLLLCWLASTASLASPTLLALVHHTGSPAASRHFFPCDRGGSAEPSLLLGAAVLLLCWLASMASLAPSTIRASLLALVHHTGSPAASRHPLLLLESAVLLLLGVLVLLETVSKSCSLKGTSPSGMGADPSGSISPVLGTSSSPPHPW